ncbi:DUF6923 family protein [Chryseobacterium echinoideorum]|uniref:DUF6923 family protein n=1 Tax=Chryseobacterium echinoideorum TaxID=1549648 RepID=UPI00162409FE|nr:VWA domain-containing protein [Chryseobacterium echinoideorum]
MKEKNNFTRYRVLLTLLLCLFTITANLKAQGVDAVFLLDNSGSIDASEWTNMSNSTKTLIDDVLQCNPSNRVAVVNYSSTYNTSDAHLYIESEFTNNATTAKSFVRRGGYYTAMGHQTLTYGAAEILKNALDGSVNASVLSPQKTLTKTPNNRLVIFVFTDGTSADTKNYTGIGGDFDIYNNLKILNGATFVVLQAPSSSTATAAELAASRSTSAAVASVGGTYTGSIDPNPGDPQGSGTKPRKMIFSSTFNVSTLDLNTVAEGICKSCAPVVSISAVTPPTQNVCLNGTPQTLVASASGTGTLSYQWYSNTTNSNIGGTLISGATSSTYNPPTSVAGTKYYYVVVKDSYCEGTTTSSVLTVTTSNSPCFSCNSNMYLSTISSGSTTLYTVDTSVSPFTYSSIGAAAIAYNGIGLNPLDGRMYAMQQSSNNLRVVNTDGSTTNLGAVTGLPSANYFGGEIDNSGNYYVIANIAAGTSTLYKINLITQTASAISLKYANNTTATLYLPDMGYSITTGLLYGVHGITGQLVTINPTTGIVTPVGSPSGAGQNFGAMYTSSTGEVFGIRNIGGFYQFNLTTGERVLISDATPSTGNDGAHCVTMPITFTTDLRIEKTDNTLTYVPGSSTTYTVVVSNQGLYGVVDALVKDAVPAGIPAANVSYTAVASSGSTTTVLGTQTGAINDLVGLPAGGSVTYTITVNIPIDFTGDLVNTASVTAPANITDSNPSNNAQTDTDSSSACFKPAQTTGTVLETQHGITSLNRAGNTASGSNWPMVRKGAWTALESKTKGLVVNRLTTAQIASIPSSNLVEGMVVYNTTLNCLQVNTTGTPSGWSCMSTPTCPSN